VFEYLIPSAVVFDPFYSTSLKKLQVEWIVIPLIYITVVPDVAVINRRYNIFLLEKSSAIASIIYDLPMLFSLSINRQNWATFHLSQYIRFNCQYINRNAIFYIQLKMKRSVNCFPILTNDITGPK